jgi:hypothetical protein
VNALGYTERIYGSMKCAAAEAGDRMENARGTRSRPNPMVRVSRFADAVRCRSLP